MTQAASIRFPDFFVVGAPRCGTTSLCRYLTRNPQICFSRPKEPHYFTTLDHTPQADELKRDYLDRCFAHGTAAQRLLGEGSVSYLYMPGVIERILHFNPNAKFIVQLRSPFTMLPSYHLRMQFLLQEDEPDFATAWGIEAARARGEHVPTHCLDTRLLLYSEIAKFGVQVERLLSLAGRDQVHVIVFDDFVSDTLGVYKRTLEFLGIDYDSQTNFERRFESQMYRYRWLQRLFFVPTTSDGKVAKTLQQRSRKYNKDGSKRKSLIKRLVNLNKVPQSTRPLSPQMKDVIRESLRPDVLHLSQLLDRDLSFWFDG